MKDFKKAIEEAKAGMMPYESWELLSGESAGAFAAFCVFRDLGADRNIRRAVECYEKDNAKHKGKYNVWRNWSALYHWQERATDHDRYREGLKQEEMRKTIEAQGEMHRVITKKMLEVVEKKLDLMNPAELAQGNVTEWVSTAIKADRDGAGLLASSGKQEVKQGELNFASDFQGL